MTRNDTSSGGCDPFHDHPALSKRSSHGPFASLNATQVHYNHVSSKTTDQYSPVNEEKTRQHGLGFKWSTRNNRKGRHALTLTELADADPTFKTPRRTSHPKAVLAGIWRMLVRYPFYDVSFDVAYIFTCGSVVWVINAFFALLPDTNPSLTFAGEVLDGGGITAFIGATIFEIGSILLMLEAVNENRSACFGWGIEELFDEGGEGGNVKISTDACNHHHKNKSNLLGKSTKEEKHIDQGTAPSEKDGTPPGPRNWIWWPSAKELRTHYLHEIGFLACSAQMFGATIFWISGFTALPGIYNNMSPGLTDGIYWVPQVIGGCGFVVSGTLFMIETQKHWWQPAYDVLGWWIGLWNLIGGIGFTLCPCFGFSSAAWAQEQAAVSTFWGSWAFLIGSVIQWYESLDKYPVEKQK